LRSAGEGVKTPGEGVKTPSPGVLRGAPLEAKTPIMGSHYALAIAPNRETELRLSWTRSVSRPVCDSWTSCKLQEVWPPGSADTVCPYPPLMRQVPHLFPEFRRGRDETYRWCELVTVTFDLETGAQCSTCRGVPSCQFWWYYDYSLSIYGLLGV